MTRQLHRTYFLSVAIALAYGFTAWSAPVTAGASGRAPTKLINGVVDVTTNLGYLNAGGAGTGMVMSKSGEVLTNNHVIRGATTIHVRDVDNGRTYVATVLGYDVAADVAVLQLRGASRLKVMPFGNAASLRVGSKVTAIGNAGGIGGTPSTSKGAVTGLHQSITASDPIAGTSEFLTGLIEINAKVEPGDSGGPLVNSSSKAVGMITAGSSGFQFQTSVSAGFAIPIGTAKSIADSIISGRFGGDIHRAATAFLGVDVNSAGYFQGGSYRAGTMVVGIIPSSPAQKVGLVPGDVITTIGNQTQVSPSTLERTLLASLPGSRVTIGWVDQFGAVQSAAVTLASGPPQ